MKKERERGKGEKCSTSMCAYVCVRRRSVHSGSPGRRQPLNDKKRKRMLVKKKKKKRREGKKRGLFVRMQKARRKGKGEDRKRDAKETGMRSLRNGELPRTLSK